MKWMMRTAAVAGFLGVALGAFGAHGLRDFLVEHGMEQIWRKAVLYHLVHAAVLVGLLGWPGVSRWAWGLLLAGMSLFSGSLYLYALTFWKPLVLVTPVGGTLMLVGWGWLVFSPGYSRNP